MRRPRLVEAGGEAARTGTDRIPVLVCSGLCVLSVCCLFVALLTIAITLESTSAPGDALVSVVPALVFGALGVVGTIVSAGLVVVFRT